MTDNPNMKWWPEDLVDEGMPDGRPTPQAWLAPDEDGITLVRDDLNAETVLTRIMPGERVQFLFYRDDGYVDITIMPDGTWSGGGRDRATIDMFDPPRALAEDTPAPRFEPDANHFFVSDEHELCCATIDALVKEIVGNMPIDEDGSAVTIGAGLWSEPTSFTVSADGASLVQAPLTGAAQ